MGMRYFGAVAFLVALVPAPAIAADEMPKASDAQKACIAATEKEYMIANATFLRKSIADGTSTTSIDNQMALRRLAVDYCRQEAACLTSNFRNADLRELILWATLARCLSNGKPDAAQSDSGPDAPSRPR